MDNTYCCVPQCNSRGNAFPRPSFHRFPTLKDKSSIERREAWIRILKIGKKVSNTMVVCGRHFQESDFFLGGKIRHKLKLNAVPSLNLPISSCDNREQLQKKEENSTKRRERKENRDRYNTVDIIQRERKMVACFAPNCYHKSVRNVCSFFRFPKKKKEFDLWTRMARRGDREPGPDSRLCSCHFVDGKKENGPSIFCRDVNKKPLVRSLRLQFPKDEKLKAMWVSAVQKKNWSPTPLSTLCSKHFTEDMIDRSSSLYIKLKDNAVPTIFNFPQKEKVSENKIPSVLPTTTPSSANKEISLEEKQRIETERLAHALRASLENASEDFFHLDFNTGITSNSSDIRLSENKRNADVQNKTVKRQKLDGVRTSSPINSNNNPSTKQLKCSNGVQSVSESINSNNKYPISSSPTPMLQIRVKQEEPWEAGYRISNDSSKNNSLENQSTESVQITKVVSLSSESNGDIVDEGNTTKELEQLDSTFYKKPLDIDGRDKSFGNFIACEISDLRENPEIYMKTKQKIIKILAEAHFEQISLGKKSLPSEPKTKS